MSWEFSPTKSSVTLILCSKKVIVGCSLLVEQLSYSVKLVYHARILILSHHRRPKLVEAGYGWVSGCDPRSRLGLRPDPGSQPETHAGSRLGQVTQRGSPGVTLGLAGDPAVTQRLGHGIYPSLSGGDFMDSGVVLLEGEVVWGLVGKKEM
jgi:hypothetical protein